jgi:ribose 5-phosphate isomerase B
MQKNIIAIGCDHAGFPYKDAVAKHLQQKGYEIKDFGTFSEQSVDFPDHVHPLANSIESGEANAGVLMCGSGNGVCMSANKHKNIRAAMVWRNDVAALARQHNDANIICIPARFISQQETIEFIDTFLNTQFEGGRHEQRVNKISAS